MHAPQARDIMIHEDRPGTVAGAILKVIAQAGVWS
jgi:hypothetical protein